MSNPIKATASKLYGWGVKLVKKIKDIPQDWWWGQRG